MNKSQRFDVLERALWTALQVASAGAIVELFGLDPKWIVPIAMLLAGLKSVLATQFGNGTASTLPASLEPVPVTADGAAVITDLPATPEAPNVTGP